jgi:flagellin-like protein
MINREAAKTRQASIQQRRVKMKGITSIIAIIVLLLITVALAGAAWVFLSGFMGTQIEKNIIITTGGAFCTSNGVQNLITVAVTNTGTTSFASPTDFTVVRVDNNDVTTSMTTVTIQTRGSGVVLNNYNCGNTTVGCSSGPHALDMGTTSNTAHQTIICP